MEVYSRAEWLSVSVGWASAPKNVSHFIFNRDKKKTRKKKQKCFGQADTLRYNFNVNQAITS